MKGTFSLEGVGVLQIALALLLGTDSHTFCSLIPLWQLVSLLLPPTYILDVCFEASEIYLKAHHINVLGLCPDTVSFIYAVLQQM